MGNVKIKPVVVRVIETKTKVEVVIKKLRVNVKNKGGKRKTGAVLLWSSCIHLNVMKKEKLYGPINKLVWGSYAPRKVMLAWARRQASKRGFPADTKKRVYIVIDGVVAFMMDSVYFFLRQLLHWIFDI